MRVTARRCAVLWSAAVFFFPVLNSFTHVAAAATATSARDVAVLSITGPVEGALAAYVDRVVGLAEQRGQRLLVHLDTNGGRLDAALAIVTTLLRLPPEKTMAYVEKKAISAGALIALACGTLIMHPDATIGDCAPISFSGEGPKMLGEKFQSPLRAKFRSLARRNGYPPLLAEAMVTPDLEVWRLDQEKTPRYFSADDRENLPKSMKNAARVVVAKGRLLTMDAAEAVHLGFSPATAESREQAAGLVFSGPVALEVIGPTWSENLSRFLYAATPFLLLIGAAGLYLEMKTPGFGVFGVMGVLFLSLVFFNQYLAGLAAYLEFFLAILGVMLLMVDFFVLPGFGVAGVSGIVAIVVALVLSFQDFIVPDPALPWQGKIVAANLFLVLGTFGGAFFVSLAALRYLVPRLGQVMEGPFLTNTLAGAHSFSDKNIALYQGVSGTARTDLHPAGKIRIGKNDLDAVTEGDYVKKGARIVVTAVKNGRIIVREEER